MRAAVWFVLLVAACTDGREYAQATCALVDVSGTYADQRQEVVGIVKRAMLPRMLPGDSLTLIRVDGQSFSKENVVANLQLDHRPSLANAQKADFARQLNTFAKRKMRSRYTDIRGGIMLCSEYLAETGAGKRVIVVFSDMKEELPPGTKRELGAKELENVRVVAMNVKKLRADNANPTNYRKRIAAWEKIVTETGASDWQVILDPTKLIAYLDTR